MQFFLQEGGSEGRKDITSPNSIAPFGSIVSRGQFRYLLVIHQCNDALSQKRKLLEYTYVSYFIKYDN